MVPEILQYILFEWSTDKECLGILLCGSYAYGMQTEYSDIDLRIIYEDSSDKKGIAGAKKIKNTTISFREDTENTYYQIMHAGIYQNSKAEVRNFNIGKILYQQKNTLDYLKKEAKFLALKPFPHISMDRQKLLLYKIWYAFDKIELLDDDDRFYKLNYYTSLNEILKYFVQLTRNDLTSEHKFSSFFSSEEFRKKYNIEEFRDTEFLDLWIVAQNEINKVNHLKLSRYIMQKFKHIDIKNFRINILNN